MKKAIRDSKWWMWVPFGCIGMIAWVVEQEKICDRRYRGVILIYNALLTSAVGALIANFFEEL